MAIRRAGSTGPPPPTGGSWVISSLSPLGLAKRLGYDRSLAALRRHLRCSKCGERKVELRMIEPERR